jgi:hypothetical protein
MLSVCRKIWQNTENGGLKWKERRNKHLYRNTQSVNKDSEDKNIFEQREN